MRLLAALLALGLAACAGGNGASGPAAASDDAEQRFPEIVEATLERHGDAYRLSVTISSPYDSAARYADGWRVLAPDGTELGSHTLTHPHEEEQPFTRTQAGLEIPAEVTEVTVEARDSVHGYGGETVTLAVPGS